MEQYYSQPSNLENLELVAFQIQQIVGNNGASFVTFVLIFGILFQVFGKAAKKPKKLQGEDGKNKNLLGLEALPKIKTIPFVDNKWIGNLPQLLPLNSTHS